MEYGSNSKADTKGGGAQSVDELRIPQHLSNLQIHKTSIRGSRLEPKY